MMLLPLLMSKLTNEHNARLHCLEQHSTYIGNLERLIEHLQADFVAIRNLNGGGFEFVVQLPVAWYSKYEAVSYLLQVHGFQVPVQMPDASLLSEHENGNLLTLQRDQNLSQAGQWNAIRGAH